MSDDVTVEPPEGDAPPVVGAVPVVPVADGPSVAPGCTGIDEGFDIDKARVPTRGDYTGKLPAEFVDKLIKDAEEFKRLWLDSLSFDIQLPHLVDLGWDEPFFGSLSRRIAKVRTGAISTAGVTVSDNTMEMFWNPIFFKNVLKREQVRGVLKHELYHIILEHVTRRRQAPATLWNAATDCAINSLIPRDELPDFCLLPGELYTPPDPPPGWQPGLISRLIKEMPRGKSSEWYMSYLLQHPEVQDAMERARGRAQKGEGDDAGSGQPGQGTGAEGRAFNRALEEELYGAGGGQFDDHDIWDRLSDDQRDMMRDYVRDIFRDCVREAESQGNGWGNVPESIRAHLKKLISREVDWRALINQFIGRSMSCRTTSSLKRINRRAPWDFPGRKRLYSARPMIALDQSGSMADEWVALFFAEVGNLGNLTEFDLVPFDHTVDEKNIQVVRRGQQPKLQRTRCGGTDFSAPVRYANERPERYDASIILTDGECCSPIKAIKPLAYIIAPGCKLAFDPQGATVIYMTDTRKNR